MKRKIVDDIVTWTTVAILIILALITFPCGPVILGFPIAYIIMDWWKRDQARTGRARQQRGQHR